MPVLSATRFRAMLVFPVLLAAPIWLATLILATAPAGAHHGWSWAEAAQSTLTGTIQSISMDPPHPSLVVEAADGVIWEIDLSNPRQTERSGFTADSAKPGDAITIIGNRSLDPGEMLMKAVRITVNGRNFDMYPDRIQPE